MKTTILGIAVSMAALTITLASCTKTSRLLITAKLGNAHAEYNLANHYWTGDASADIHVLRDRHKAITWYRKSATQGYVPSEYKLASAYWVGEGTLKDYSKAAKWFRKAAEHGYAAAEYNVGGCYEHGIGVPRNYHTAAEWYKQAAVQGYVQAEYSLGNAYMQGHGVPEDHNMAAGWYKKAAVQGYAPAEYALGSSYVDGNGVPKDYNMAIEWNKKAAMQGYAPAEYYIGVAYKAGQYLPQDYGMAVKWLRRAAVQGYASGEYVLGLFYATGNGVPRSYVLAYMLFDLGASNGNEQSHQIAEELESHMTSAQISEAQSLAANWMVGSPLPNNKENISVLAGSGAPGRANGAGVAASFDNPTGVTVDSGANVYVADFKNIEIRKITPAGVVTTLAGSPAIGNDAAASFVGPMSVAVDSVGTVYVTDEGSNQIRKITSAGMVTTLAGSATKGSANGTGSAASFRDPSGIAVDSAGNVYVADSGNNEIRKISPAGVVSTLAGSTTPGSANGTGAAASFNGPTDIAVDSASNIYVADVGNSEIRKITPAGVVTTLFGSPPASGAPQLRDQLQHADTSHVAQLVDPFSIAVDFKGDVYAAYPIDNEIREITPAGVVTMLVNLPTSRSTPSPDGIAVDSAGQVYVSDADNNEIVKISRTAHR